MKWETLIIGMALCYEGVENLKMLTTCGVISGSCKIACV